ncbi:extra-large G-protein 1 [Tasmannia lanceolata]|uniref:extra-large G-protein 1 n=1 Tax=Tasmannia lanceolata TaxID=3420 RepID=UPI0040632C72
MAELLRRMLPVGAPIPDNEDELDYSFAVEYNGPPVNYDLPQALPIDIEHIPTASVVAVSSLSDRLSLPVVQPLMSPDPLRKASKDVTLGSDSVVSPTSVIAFDERGMDCRGCGLSDGIDSSGALDFSNGRDGSHDTPSEIDSSGALGFSNGRDGSHGSPSEIDTSGVLGFSNGLDMSCELSSGIGSSGLLGFSDEQNGSHELIGHIGSSAALGVWNGDSGLHELSGEIGSSGTLEFFNGHDQSRELFDEIGSSGALGFSKDFKESVDFSNDMNPPDWVSTESMLSSTFLSSEDSSRRTEDREGLPLTNAKRTSLVTFHDTVLSDVLEVESNPVETTVTEKSKEPSSKIKKGACHWCFKGNRFTEKESCLVCNAKYCTNCVLRAMGSMPEGRKCIACIGLPIDESKRESLGKCSRMLKRVLDPLEINLVMKAEKLSEANQLQSEHISVNGKKLCPEEMVLLQGCPNPPIKLKPGSYWYDKVSGLWGKEGQKPCKIISPHLNVGGNLMVTASNGNTKIFINGREISKAELRLLQWAGVQCAGNPHFWVNADGSYQEEGQRNIKGNIWGKAGTKLYCSFLSLPIPPNTGKPSREEVNNLVRSVADYPEPKMLQKLLLVGYHGCGANTIFKQAKFLYKAVPFSEEERESIKCTIQSNAYGYLGILLEGRERFEEENLLEIRKTRLLDQSEASGHVDEGDDVSLYSISPRLKAFSDWLLKAMVSGNLEAIFPAATREHAPLVEDMWKDAAIQATYSRRRELQMLPSVANYFLERVVDISRMEYEPSDADILRAEGGTSSNGLAYTEFVFPKSAYDDTIDGGDEHDPLLRYQLIKVHAKGLGENRKWLEMFEDVRIVIFCVALSDYDQFCDDGTGAVKNKMLLNKKLFEILVGHPTFEQMEFLLILNKFDVFEQKIERVPLSACDWFDDYNPVISRHGTGGSNSNNVKDATSPAQQAFHYIAVKFKRLFYSFTGRNLYVSQTNGLEGLSVDEALRYAREILRWDEDRAIFSISDYSVYSTDPSSFSH